FRRVLFRSQPRSLALSETPSFFRILSIRHQLVREDCKRLAPTKAVNHSHFILTVTAKARLIRTKLPAMPLIALFLISFILLFYIAHKNRSTGISTACTGCSPPLERLNCANLPKRRVTCSAWIKATNSSESVPPFWLGNQDSSISGSPFSR